MTADARSDDDVQDETEGGMTVAAVVTLTVVGLIGAGLFLAAMHAAGTGRGLW